MCKRGDIVYPVFHLLVGYKPLYLVDWEDVLCFFLWIVVYRASPCCLVFMGCIE